MVKLTIRERAIGESMKFQKIKDGWNTWFLYFLVYSMCGWIYEVLVALIEYHRGFVNRGFLWGPYCPVYGFGGLLIVLSIQKLKKTKVLPEIVKFLLCFLSIVALTSVVELLTSYLMEAALGQWLWDYSDYAYNFQGRVALKSSLRFGIGGMMLLYGLQPVLEWITNKCKNAKAYSIITYIIFVAFMLDVVIHLVVGSNFVQK